MAFVFILLIRCIILIGLHILDHRCIPGINPSCLFMAYNLLKINLFYFFNFIFGCVGSLLLHAGFSLVAASRGYSSLWCAGFSLWWLLLL